MLTTIINRMVSTMKKYIKSVEEQASHAYRDSAIDILNKICSKVDEVSRKCGALVTSSEYVLSISKEDNKMISDKIDETIRYVDTNVIDKLKHQKYIFDKYR